VKTNVNMRKRF